MMTKFWILGAGGVLLFVHAGCSREPSAAKPQAGRVADAPRQAEKLDAEPAREPIPSPASESNSHEPVFADEAPDDAVTSQVAADLKRMADPLTTPEEWDAAQTRILAEGVAAVPVLAGGLTSDNPVEREMAATLLAVVGEGLEQAEQPLRNALRDESPYVRANAATALCQLPGTDEAVIPVLQKLLDSSDPNLRQIAATNLGNFDSESEPAPAVKQVSGTLEDERP